VLDRTGLDRKGKRLTAYKFVLLSPRVGSRPILRRKTGRMKNRLEKSGPPAHAPLKDEQTAPRRQNMAGKFSAGPPSNMNLGPGTYLPMISSRSTEFQGLLVNESIINFPGVIQSMPEMTRKWLVNHSETIRDYSGSF
jgi:hypothetical protein